MTLFSFTLILHIAVALMSVSSAVMSFFVSSEYKKIQAFIWSAYGVTIVTGVALYLMVPSTLGRSCAMMLALTPMALIAHQRLAQKILQNS